MILVQMDLPMTQQRPSLPSVQRSPYLCHYADKCRTWAVHAPIEEVNNAITLKKKKTLFAKIYDLKTFGVSYLLIPLAIVPCLKAVINTRADKEVTDRHTHTQNDYCSPPAHVQRDNYVRDQNRQLSVKMHESDNICLAP